MNDQESLIASGIALPLKDLEYNDRIDYAANCSVMEPLGGPSPLVGRRATTAPPSIASTARTQYM